MVRHAPITRVELRLVGFTERRRPENDAVLAAGALTLILVFLLLCGRFVVFFPFLRFGVHPQEDQPGPVLAPHHLAAVRLLLVARHAGGRRRPADAGVELGLLDLGKHVALAVPDLLDAAEAGDRDDVAVRLDHRRDTRVPPVRREVEVADHRRVPDADDAPVVDRDQGQLAGDVPFEQRLVVRRRHEACVCAQHVPAVLGLLDLRAARDARRHGTGGPVFRHQDGRDLVAGGCPFEVGDHRRQNGVAGDLP